MNSHACNRMPTLAALLLIALLALIPSLPSTPAPLPPALADIGLVAAPEVPAADAQVESRSSADQLGHDDTAVLPTASPWRPVRIAASWPQPAAWHGSGTHPRPRLRPPSA
ncbi:hypothetical protein FZ025_01140 [Xanthomonas hyacinthi]|uniref:Secreted protein n=1 Tax=Xanthomonas hyacinthi TaxID=56455 RepID=A0A2S7ERR2_9XANT|nr:hypothetical protein [Xanthomonas hyacinthi]PPU95806.1 hypothetical protein XhyaCFBP1156_17465 [Xanthomonas hyacinthi]QGY75343.1 hypothetical protein FZ025_01140 [Xanthomonas hyacinthi]